MEYDEIIKNPINFTYALKTIKDKGNLVYEYNPFRNYRLTENMFEYDNSLYTYSDLKSNFEICLYFYENRSNLNYVPTDNDYVPANDNEVIDILLGDAFIRWKKNGINLNDSEAPILRRPGELVDFETDELSFNINHPVDILPQYSYDGSVNLIINDGINLPRLINSRFSPTERNQYQIVDRKGDNDTNIYNLGEEFDINTSLHKKTKTIPSIKYNGTFTSGNLPIGNYHFYFRYMDADGNESDFIAESGLVSVFIGDTPYNIHTGSRNENSHKGVSFLLLNLDSGYLYLSVFYTKATADILENRTVAAFKINQKYLINTANVCALKITGFEETTEIPLTDINLQYLVFDEVETLALCLNRLFFGNISSLDLDYKELLDISLRIFPYYTIKDYNISEKIDETYLYIGNSSQTYYDSRYIYDNVGYWPGEVYRFGVVFIKDDGTLTSVFNIRGTGELPAYSDNVEGSYSHTDYRNNTDSREYIKYNEESNIIISDSRQNNLENCKGVVRFPEFSDNKVFGIGFELLKDNGILADLQGMGIRGYFFVRQKRIPTILCLALTIGIDEQSHTPVIPYYNASDTKPTYISECFLGKESPFLTHDYDSRCAVLGHVSSDLLAAICPEYDVDYPYYNTLFSGDKFVIGQIKPIKLVQESWNHRHYYNLDTDTNNAISKQTVLIQAVEDNTKLVAIGESFFSARAGEMEEVRKFEFLEQENKSNTNTRLLRGSYGPFLGIKGSTYKSSLINIYIPGYNESNLSDYFLIRYNDKSPFYAISDRYKVSELILPNNFYRGDCYICQFTHRLNRNFQDSSAPTNDMIVDPKCWENNFKYEDGVLKKDDLDKINLGDVNAVLLGLWITFTLRSTKNLNIRTIDSSNVDESALFGHSRGYYPYLPLSARGVYKIPESLCYNKGFEKSLSERYNFEVPDIPFIKNDFSNRISYSNIIINDAFLNGGRIFSGLDYRDYPKTYGSITKLIELSGDLLCVFEHGVAVIPVNERTVAGEGSGGSVYINTSNVLPENPKVLSDTFGSLWKDSIIKTPNGVYGVDTIGKKIWKTNGSNFECISDLHIQEFLNLNISLTERELTPIIGIRNVKTHYNKFKGDVMFTFYDNLYGFEEKVWNICYNEILGKWVTFYSWVPSYSENIYNLYFSFNRDTSKWISKLGTCLEGSNFADGILLSENIINDLGFEATVSFKDGFIDGDKYKVSFSLERDNYKNYKLFNLDNCTLSLKDILYDDLRSELYVREYVYKDENGSITYLLDNPRSNDTTAHCKEKKERVGILPLRERIDKDGNKILGFSTLKEIWTEHRDLKIYKDEQGRRVNLSENCKIRENNIVYLLNIRASLAPASEDNTPTKAELVNRTKVDSGYFESVVAVIPKYNMLFLTTDFWRHGQAGIIDISDKVAPTYWYGKLHPFEFEFVVASMPDCHKIFDNLEIISNKAEPESFHYEIVGECYDFAKDKKNMYIRQEATKELYLFNGSDIVYNPDYKTLNSEPRLISGLVTDKYDKSTIFPLYYSRQDKINEIEDYYHLYGHKDTYGKSDPNFSALAGAEIVRYPNLDEYRIWNHAKAVDIHNFEKGGRMRGNMQYKEDKWDVQINPLNLVQRNENYSDWTNVFGDGKKKMVPAECNLFAPPTEVYNKDESKGTVTLPSDWERNVVNWKIPDKLNKEVKLKDKFIKIRIRYSGKDLAIISAIRTLYSISYA